MMNIIDIIFMFVLLPIGILSDSWKRLRRIGWEWAIFGFVAMSVFAALMEDVVGPALMEDFARFKGKNAFIIFVLPQVIILGGVGIFFKVYSSVEQPIRARGKLWRVLRSIAAAFVAAISIVSMSEALRAGSLKGVGSPTYGWLLVAGAAAFILTSVACYSVRDKEKIAEYERTLQKDSAPAPEEIFPSLSETPASSPDSAVGAPDAADEECSGGPTINLAERGQERWLFEGDAAIGYKRAAVPILIQPDSVRILFKGTEHILRKDQITRINGYFLGSYMDIGKGIEILHTAHDVRPRVFFSPAKRDLDHFRAALRDAGYDVVEMKQTFLGGYKEVENKGK